MAGIARYKSEEAKDRQRRRIRQAVAEGRERKKAYVRQQKERPCVDCGRQFPPCCMHFDHVQGEKVLAVSRIVHWGWDKIKAEIAKCEVRCSICHTLRHNDLDPNREWGLTEERKCDRIL